MAVVTRKKTVSGKGKKLPVNIKTAKSVSKKVGQTASVAKKPVAKKPVAKKPVAKKPVAKKPVAKKPLAEKPVVKKPVVKKSVAKKPLAEKPVVKKPVVKKPVVKKPVVKKPVVKKPVVKKSVAKKPLAEKPVTKKTAKVIKPHEQAALSGDRLPELKKSLLRKREIILKEAKDEIARYISGENKQLVDTANDDGDWAQVDISEDLSLQRLSAHRKLLHDIDEAVRKIGEGTYGICEECGEEISDKRLLVIPTATLCVDCQEQKEQFEEFESTE
ncbi:MAG: histone H1-like repetitive region-containing protein [Methanothrix sp.]|nr:histone H1-like repetitive region-containing protein [Methanothrix sp.]